MEIRTLPRLGGKEEDVTRLKELGQFCKNIAYLAVGSVICAVAINGILVPHHFLNGGLSGVAMALHFFYPKVTISTAYIAPEHPLSFSWLG